MKAFGEEGGLVFDSTSILKKAPSKAQEEQVFADPEFERFGKKGGTAGGFLDKFLQWLADKLFDRAGPENILTVRRILIWTIVIISLVVVARLLLRSEISGLVRPRPAAAAFNFSDIIEDLSTLDFSKKIEEAIRLKDYRLALRWQYLKLLFLLDKRSYILFAPFKTNIDYQRELSESLSKPGAPRGQKQSPLQHSFVRLSRVYEFVWYGQFAVSEADYQVHASEFKNAEEQINV